MSMVHHSIGIAWRENIQQLGGWDLGGQVKVQVVENFFLEKKVYGVKVHVFYVYK